MGVEKKNQILKAFDKVADYYDEYMKQTGHVQAQRKISHKLKRKLGNSSILDVATGTGVMIEDWEDAVGVDASERMIERAREKVPDKEFHVADVVDLPFEDGSFDYSMSCLAFLWFTNRERALDEMLRVSRKGAFVVEEEDTPARKRIDIPDELEPFFEKIEELEVPINVGKMDENYERVCEADIDGSHRFVAWCVEKGKSWISTDSLHIN